MPTIVESEFLYPGPYSLSPDPEHLRPKYISNKSSLKSMYLYLFVPILILP